MPRRSRGSGSYLHAFVACGCDVSARRTQAVPKAPPCRRAGRVEDPPASGREFGCKFADGSSATLDLENGRVRLHAPFGNVELKS